MQTNMLTAARVRLALQAKNATEAIQSKILKSGCGVAGIHFAEAKAGFHFAIFAIRLKPLLFKTSPQQMKNCLDVIQ